MLTFALPTGRSVYDCIELLDQAGLPVEKLKKPGRNLVIEEGNFRYLLAKPMDVPAMVHYGAADLALAGSDVIEESGVALAELLDTQRGKCTMAIAGPPEAALKFNGHISRLMGLRVATKYVNVAAKTFASWGVQIKILKLNGSVELAPALKLCDCIFDIVQTGNTLRANGLSVIKETAPVSLRLVAGVGAVQTRWNAMFGVVEAIGGCAVRGAGN
ncbi:ATP phosphoribosyltransferase [Synergistaceae bacterium OttesenSCG-928-D05]|nr:ATP phosphoribosyltransferase [Synergistaceae bacterium OttesenSCG-928-D05]